MTETHRVFSRPSETPGTGARLCSPVLLLLGVAIVAAACAQGTATSDADGVVHAQMHMQGASEDTTLFERAPAATIPLTAADLSFAPAALRGAKDSSVEIALQNNGALAHDFTIDKINVDQAIRRDGDEPAGHQHVDQYAVHVALAPGQSARLRLHLHQAGSYEFFCTVPGHREAGMKGVLVVQ